MPPPDLNQRIRPGRETNALTILLPSILGGIGAQLDDP